MQKGQTLTELAQLNEVHPNQITNCKRQLAEQAATVFDKNNDDTASVDLKELHAYDSVSKARRSILEYFDWYNRCRPCSSLGRQTPEEAYNIILPAIARAA